MKKIISLVLVLGLTVSLVGCNETKKESLYSCDTLNVFSWGEYIDEETLRMFEDENNVRVNYSLFDSNESMYTQLLGGNDYDVLVPSDYMIERLIEEDLVQKLDLSLIKNFGNIADGVKNVPFDPNNEYSIPFFWGSVGIVYDHTVIDPKKVEELGYDIFLDEGLKGQAFFYDSERDSFMTALKALGYSMNTEDEKEIEEAYQWLLKVDKVIDPAYVTDEVIDGMIYGEKLIANVYSGDAAYALSENSNLSYHEPLKGTNKWIDSMVITKNSKCTDLAHAYLDFMLSEEASTMNSEYVGYTGNTNQAIKALSDEGGYYHGNNAYLARSEYEHDESFKHNEVLKQKLADLWIKVKNS